MTMITKEQAQAHKSAFQQSNAKTPAFVQTVSASVCMDYLNTIIALHERVERLMDFIMEPVTCHIDTGWLECRSAILKETTND